METDQTIRARLAPDFARVVADRTAFDAWVATLTGEEQAVVTTWITEATANVPSVMRQIGDALPH